MASKPIQEEEHSKYGASKAARWLNCPGSIALAEKAPPEQESRYAKEGTEAHKCLEFLLKNRQRLPAALKTAAKTYNPEMVAHAEDVVAWVEAQVATDPGEIHPETKVDSSSFTTANQFGTLDIAITREFGRLTIADYKYGAGVAVDVVESDGKLNAQLVYYALAMSLRYDHAFSEVELVVIQPRAFHESGEVIRSTVITMDELLKWAELFAVGVRRCESGLAETHAGSWCKFCPAAVICPELKNKAMRDAQVAFDDDKGLMALPDLMLAPIPNLGRMLDAADKIEAWIKRLREHAFQVLERGGAIPGFKLVAKRGQREWTDEGRITKEARKRFGDLAFTTPCLHSPAQLEKAARGTKGINEWISERTEKKSSGTRLAHESDKAPAVKTMEQIFPETMDAEFITKPVVLSAKLPNVKPKAARKG